MMKYTSKPLINLRYLNLLNKLSALFVFTLTVVFVSPANAEVLLAKSRTQPAIYGGASYYVDFNGGSPGGKVYNFSTTRSNTKVVFMFNAECAVDGNSFKWVNIDIRVNPAGAPGEFSVSPTNGDNALCSGNTTASDFLYGSGDGWVSATSIGVATIANPGNHTVRVRVDGSNSGIARLDDMSLVVMK